MKFTTSTLFFAIFSTAKAAQVQDRALATLADQWSIADPAFAIDGLGFTFDYPVSNFIDQNQAYYEVYDAGCKAGANLISTGITSSPLVDVTTGSVTDDGAFLITGEATDGAMVMKHLLLPLLQMMKVLIVYLLLRDLICCMQVIFGLFTSRRKTKVVVVVFNPITIVLQF